MKQPLIILDRDGVINYDSEHYIKNPDEWIPIESSLSAIARLTEAGYKIGVATNQSGISRQYFTESTLAQMHKKMLQLVQQKGGCIDAIEYCPDHPDNPGPDRKPAPGMALKLLKRFKAQPDQTWFVGDTISDINCAINAGCKPVLVLTGKGQKTLLSPGLDPAIPVFEDLNSFVEQLLNP